MNTPVSPRSSTKITTVIGKALKLFNDAFEPFVKQCLKNHYKGDNWESKVKETLNKMDTSKSDYTPNAPLVYDTQMILFIMLRLWTDVFEKTLRLTSNERAHLYETRTVRNKWAHQNSFSYEDCYRALDTIERLLIAIQADTEKEELSKLRVYILFKLANKMKELEKETANAKPVQKPSSTTREKSTTAPSTAPEKEASRITSPQYTEEQRQYLQQQQLQAQQQQQYAQQQLLHQQQQQQQHQLLMQQIHHQQQQQQIAMYQQQQQYQRQQQHPQQQHHSNQMDIE